MLNEKEVIIKALKAEASIKPNELIYIGLKSYTFKEFVEMLNHYDKLDKQTKHFIDRFINKAIVMFRENDEFRNKMLGLAGEAVS